MTTENKPFTAAQAAQKAELDDAAPEATFTAAQAAQKDAGGQ